MKKVLIIAYYWPPSGGGGVQRWLKFVRYLPVSGWIPVVYVPENPDYPHRDESLLKEVPEDLLILRQPIWEPYHLYRSLLGKKDSSKAHQTLSAGHNKTWKQKLSTWVRGNFFIPDARKFWIKPSVKYLQEWLKKNPVDAVITTGPPHSLHLIGRNLKRLTGCTWIADFRDPWTNIEYYGDLMLSRRSDRKHRELEASVMKEADTVVTVSWTWEKMMQQLGALKTKVLTNGFDANDFPQEATPLSSRFTIAHLGTLSHDRAFPFLWQTLKKLTEEIPGFAGVLEIELTGPTDPHVIAAVHDAGLDSFLRYDAYVPHTEAVLRMRKASVLLLLINNVSFNAGGRIPGKIFEYLAAHRPVLCIGPPEGDSARILRETGAGVTVSFDDEQALRNAILSLYESFRRNELHATGSGYSQYSRQAITQSLAALLNELTATSRTP